MYINDEIKKEIKAKGYTWDQVAEKLGLDYVTFHLWMKSRLTWQRAEIIRNGLRERSMFLF